MSIIAAVVVFDTNIVLEMLQRRRYYSAVKRIMARLEGDEISITTLTTSNVFYVAERKKLNLQQVETRIRSFHHLAVLSADVTWALAHYGGDDFEDALQIATAIREGCTLFVTLDAALTKKYSTYLNIELIGGKL